MNDYIKRSDAVKTLRMIKNCVDIFLQSIDDAASAVDDLATKADVRENVHAHWIKHNDGGIDVCYECSECLRTIFFADVDKRFRYCPSCGSIMDEEAET